MLTTLQMLVLMTRDQHNAEAEACRGTESLLIASEQCKGPEVPVGSVLPDEHDADDTTVCKHCTMSCN